MNPRRLLNDIPDNLFFMEVSGYLDAKSVANVSVSSKSFFSVTRDKQFWQSNLNASGVKLEELKKVNEAKLNINYNKIFKHIIGNIKQINNNLVAWEILSLSGNPLAIRYAKQNLNLTGATRNVSYMSPLHFAALSGSPSAIEEALTLPDTNLLHCDRLKRNALSYAVLSGSVAAVKLLLLKGKYNLEQVDRLQQTVFLLAAQSGSIELMRYLADALNVPCGSVDVFGANALHLAADSKNIEAMRYCFFNKSIFPTIERATKYNLLHRAVISGSPNVVLFARQITRSHLDETDNKWKDVFDYANEHENCDALLKALEEPVESIYEVGFKRKKG